MKKRNQIQKFKEELISSINNLHQEKDRAKDRKDRQLVKLIDFQISECRHHLDELE